MSTPNSTPAKRVTLALAALVYIFASHGALAGGLLLQAVWIVLGFGLARLLVGSVFPSALGWPIGRRSEREPERTVSATPRVIPTLDVAESL
jgi:hypothetical protein